MKKPNPLLEDLKSILPTIAANAFQAEQGRKVPDENIALLKGIGMRLEAHYREHALFQGEWDEELHFAILDREWKPSEVVREFPRKSGTQIARHLVA